MLWQRLGRFTRRTVALSKPPADHAGRLRDLIGDDTRRPSISATNPTKPFTLKRA